MDTSMPEGVRKMFADAGIELEKPRIVQVMVPAAQPPVTPPTPGPSTPTSIVVDEIREYDYTTTPTGLDTGMAEVSLDPPAQPVQLEPVASDATPDCLSRPVEPSDYIEPKWADYLLNIWDTLGARSPNAVLLTGPRGTGKTLAAEVYAARRSRLLLVCNCNPEMTAESLLGTPRLSLKKHGGDYWMPGPIMLAAQYNAVLLLDEFTSLGTASQVALNPLADRAGLGGVFIPYTGERLSWLNPRIICAVNEGYAGTRDIQPALRDRFETMHAVYLDPSDEEALLVARTGCDAPLAAKAVACANAIRAAARGEYGQMPLDFDLSPRPLMSFCDRAVAGQPHAVAWREAVLGRIGYSFRTEATRAAVEQISSAAGLGDQP